ncbi:MAG: hypothetical protein JO323_12745 [Acidobacteriia bacterium]|nr:hypothetical protein [Terriglobia bacterium]
MFGSHASGRTSVFVGALAQATRRSEICALVDASDSFDPVRAEAVSVYLPHLLLRLTLYTISAEITPN